MRHRTSDHDPPHAPSGAPYARCCLTCWYSRGGGAGDGVAGAGQAGERGGAADPEGNCRCDESAAGRTRSSSSSGDCLWAVAPVQHIIWRAARCGVCQGYAARHPPGCAAGVCHLHSLSCVSIWSGQTGGMSRDIERGTKGISFLLTSCCSISCRPCWKSRWWRSSCFPNTAHGLR